MIKASANALVARDGVLAARLAQHGLTGPDRDPGGQIGSIARLRSARRGFAARDAVGAADLGDPQRLDQGVPRHRDIAGRDRSGRAVGPPRGPRLRASRRSRFGCPTPMPPGSIWRSSSDSARTRGNPPTTACRSCSPPRSRTDDSRSSSSQASGGGRPQRPPSWSVSGSYPTPRSGNHRPTQLSGRGDRGARGRPTIHRSRHRCARQPLRPMGFRRDRKKFADTDRVGFSPAQRSALVAAAAALPRAADMSELMTATAVLNPSTRSERVGAAPGERI